MIKWTVSLKGEKAWTYCIIEMKHPNQAQLRLLVADFGVQQAPHESGSD